MTPISTSLYFWSQERRFVRHVRLVPGFTHSISCRNSAVSELTQELATDNVPEADSI